jgi:hypothetical protein
MPRESVWLVFLAGGPDVDGPWRIKVSQGLGAIVGFGSAEAARHFAAHWHVPPDILSLEEVGIDRLEAEGLLVFQTVEEIDAAYRDQATYDFSKHIREVPRA